MTNIDIQIDASKRLLNFKINELADFLQHDLKIANRHAKVNFHKRVNYSAISDADSYKLLQWLELKNKQVNHA